MFFRPTVILSTCFILNIAFFVSTGANKGYSILIFIAAQGLILLS